MSTIRPIISRLPITKVLFMGVLLWASRLRYGCQIVVEDDEQTGCGQRQASCPISQHLPLQSRYQILFASIRDDELMVLAATDVESSGVLGALLRTELFMGCLLYTSPSPRDS